MLTGAGIAAVGLVDHMTGIEVRIFPLYFLPLVLAAWRFGKAGAWIGSVVVTGVWMVTMFTAGRHYSHGWIWVVNFFTQGSAFAVVAHLVASLQRSYMHERDLGSTDALTGLANRRAFYERAETALALCHRNRRPVSIAYIDLDNFKGANDRFGHKHGDRVLRAVATAFHDALRRSDLPARIGGDEFVVLLPETTRDKAVVVLEDLSRQLREHPELRACSVTASIGCLVADPAPASLDVLLSRADATMYRAKTAGKDRVVVETLAVS